MTRIKQGCRPMPWICCRLRGGGLGWKDQLGHVVGTARKGIRCTRAAAQRGKLSVVTEVADIFRTRASASTRSWCCGGAAANRVRLRNAENRSSNAHQRWSSGGDGGFGGFARPSRRVAPEFRTRERRRPESRCHPPERAQALIYRLSGDRNPLHSDPWFAGSWLGFPSRSARAVQLRGAGRAVVANSGKGVAANVTSIASRFTSPCFRRDADTLIWRTEPGKAVFRTEASDRRSRHPGGARRRRVEYVEG